MKEKLKPPYHIIIPFGPTIIDPKGIHIGEYAIGYYSVGKTTVQMKFLSAEQAEYLFNNFKYEQHRQILDDYVSYFRYEVEFIPLRRYV